MFSNQLNRYITRRGNERGPYLLQKKLWQLIDESVKRKERLDYLQVFKLEKEDSQYLQKITYGQEKPRRETNSHQPVNYLGLKRPVDLNNVYVTFRSCLSKEGKTFSVLISEVLFKIVSEEL